MKQTIKQKKEAAEKAALLRRITDVYSGAAGLAWDDNEFAAADTLSRVMPVLEAIFGPQYPNRKYLWSLSLLNKFDSPESAADFLYGNGIRAGKL